jgi:hypothetical protein
MRIALVATVLCLFAGSALAQTREAGPWWPNPTWGRGDQAGAKGATGSPGRPIAIR